MKDTNDKKWFEKLRVNSWEIEILIVACILAALFNIPDIMQDKLQELLVSNHFDFRNATGNGLPFWYVIGIIKTLSYSVIASFLIIAKFTFSLYIIFRGFWVAVIGLSSVFNNGIDLNKLNYSSYFEKIMPKTKFNDYVLKLDNVCSSIFSLGFLVAFFLLSIFLFIAESILIFSLLPMEEISVVGNIFVLVLASIGFIFFVDILFLGLLKKIKWKLFSYIYSKLYNFLRIATCFFLYESVYYLFISNVKRRVVLICWFFVIVFFIINVLSNKADGYLVFPDLSLKENPAQSFMIKQYYEDRLLASSNNFSYTTYPFINSEIISDSYLKIYIPFHPYMHSSLDSACVISQDSTIIKDTVFTLSSNSGIDGGVSIRANSTYFQKLINCINSQYAIYIDQDTIENDFVFYDYSAKTDDQDISIKSFFMPIPISKYKEGKHVITIEKLFYEEQMEEYKGGEWVSILSKGQDSLIHIPFYIYR